MELLGGLLVLAVVAYVGLSVCAGGLCTGGKLAKQPAPQPNRRQRH